MERDDRLLFHHTFFHSQNAYMNTYSLSSLVILLLNSKGFWISTKNLEYLINIYLQTDLSGTFLERHQKTAVVCVLNHRIIELYNS